jgi:hypothetical protein
MVKRNGVRTVKVAGFRGGKVMRSLKILGIVGFAAAMTGCVPDWARDNETGIIMEIAGITGFAGGEAAGGTEGDILMSDVVTDGTAFNDDAVVLVNIYRKNPTVAATSALEHVRLESYSVRYFRTDGHSVEGVDVPHRITGALNSIRLHTPTETDEVEAEVVITLVRQQAKLEPPLLNLRGGFVSPTANFLLPGQSIITTVAEITVFARQVVTGEALSATGRFQVTFADFGDE